MDLYRAGSIGEYAFQAALLPDYVQIGAASVGDYAFLSARGKTIVFNATVKEIGEGAFMSCDGEVYLGSGIRTVGAYAFAGYGFGYRVNPMQIPATIETIGEKAFGYFVKKVCQSVHQYSILNLGILTEPNRSIYNDNRSGFRSKHKYIQKG